jgi:hypothetical protein
LRLLHTPVLTHHPLAKETFRRTTITHANRFRLILLTNEMSPP